MAVVPLDKDVFFLLSTKPSINVFVGCGFFLPARCDLAGEKLCPLNSAKRDNAFVLVWKLSATAIKLH